MCTLGFTGVPQLTKEINHLLLDRTRSEQSPQHKQDAKEEQRDAYDRSNECHTDQTTHKHKNSTKDNRDEPTRKREDGGHQPPESFERPHHPWKTVGIGHEVISPIELNW
jgi:hypothetical protein